MTSNSGRIQWYGERGILNTLVSDIAGDDFTFLNRTRDLLSAIKWADAGHRDWIGRVHDALYIVEMRLADFGNPDLLIVCRASPAGGSREEETYVVCIEAKLRPYRFAATESKGPMSSTLCGRASGGWATRTSRRPWSWGLIT